MVCPKCGAEIPDESEHCSECGEQINKKLHYERLKQKQSIKIGANDLDFLCNGSIIVGIASIIISFLSFLSSNYEIASFFFIIFLICVVIFIGWIIWLFKFSPSPTEEERKIAKEKAEEILTKREAMKNMNAKNSDEIRCPKCGSTQIYAGKRGWKVTTGFIGSSKIMITCLKCGHQWKAGN